MIQIEERPFQQFCYAGRGYRENFGKTLTQMQERVLSVVRNHGPVEAAIRMGLTPQKIQSHISHIKAKGWAI